VKKILIVDDSRINLTSLRMLLKYAPEVDAEVVAVSTVGDALTKLSKKDIDLVLCDVNLGSEYGPDIKRAYPKVPFIYLTGDGTWDSPDKSPVMTKPYNHQALYSKINKILGESMRNIVLQLAVGSLNVDAAIDQLIEVAPPGFSGTVKAMKDKHGMPNDKAFPLAWAMYKKGAKPHKKPESDAKGIKSYIPPEEYAKRKKKKAGKVLKMPTRSNGVKKLAASLEM